jgi:hypothetical protein
MKKSRPYTLLNMKRIPYQNTCEIGCKNKQRVVYETLSLEGKFQL